MIHRTLSLLSLIGLIQGVLHGESIPDYGFENVSPNGGLKDWRANAGAGHPFEELTAIRDEPSLIHSGKSAVKLVQSGKTRDGRELIGHLYSKISIRVEAGEHYSFRFFARGSGKVGAFVYCYTMQDGQSVFSHSTGVKADEASARAGFYSLQEPEKWKRCSFTFVAPPRSKSVYNIRLVIRTRGTVYVDDCEFVREPQEVSPRAREDAPPVGSFRPNLVSVVCRGSVPKVDGRIDALEYTTQWSGLIENTSNTLYPQRGEFFLSGDLQQLYFGMAVQLPANYKLRARGKGRDDPALIFDTDIFYLFFRRDDQMDAKGFKGVYLAVSSEGNVYDAWEDIHWKEASCHRDASFNAGWRVATSTEAGHWSIELSVPWKDLGVTPRPKGQTFAFAFGLNLQGAQITWQAFSNWYDHYQAFGELRVATEGLAVKVPKLGEISRGRASPKLSVTNATEAKQTFGLASLLSTPRKVAGQIAGYVFDVELDPSREQITGKDVLHDSRDSGSLAPGAKKTIQSVADLKKPGHYVLELEARMGGTSWFYQKLPFRYLPPIEASLRPVPSREEIEIKLRFHGARHDERGKVSIRFRDANGKEPLTHVAQITGDEISLVLSMSKLPPGDYEVSFELFGRTNNKVWTATQLFKKWETPEWLKNRKGLEALEPDWVPAPWDPIGVDGTRISLWGRKIAFQRGSLIAQIESQDVPLLSDAASVGYSYGEKDHSIVTGEAAVEFEDRGMTVLTQQGDSPHFALSVRHTIEFDGMHRLDLAVHPKKAETIEKLWIDLPFSQAQYLFFTSQSGLRSSAWQAGLFPEEGRSRPDFYKWIWLGNDKVGCCFFVENYKGWILNSEKPRIVLKNDGETKLLRLLLINEPSEVSEPLKITIGLMATPVKPFFNGWRDMRAQGLNIGTPPASIGIASPDYWNSHYSRPTPRNWIALNDMVSYAHERGQRIYPYLGLLYLSPYEYLRSDFGFTDFSDGTGFPSGVSVKKRADAKRLEEYFYFKADWDLTPPSVSTPTRETRVEVRLTPGSSYADYFAHGIHEMLTRSDVDGYFFDIDNPMLDRNPDKGNVYRTKDGREEGTYEMFAIRDLYKRLYYLFDKHRGPERKPYIIGHGFAMSAPYMSFWDAALNGEEIKPKKKFEFTRTFLQKRLYGNPVGLVDDDESIRSYDAFSYRCAHGAQSGLPAMFLPQYGYVSSLKTNEHAREILSFTFLHNDTLWLAYIPSQPVLEFWRKVEVSFGMGDTDFFPYWENAIKSEPECIRVSYWKKKKAKDWLVAVANWSGRKTEASIQLPPSLSAIATWREMETGRQTPAGRQWKVTIPAHDLRVFRSSK